MKLTHEQRISNIIGTDSFLMIPFGSRVYGTASYSSDHDYYVIGDSLTDNQEIRNGDLNFHTYTRAKFKDLVQSHHVGALECYMVLPPSKQHGLNFNLDLELLRTQFSATSSNSWVKAKKKLTVEENVELIGTKSLWHSLRILMFGIQIAKHGSIVDWHEANKYFDDIKDNPTWVYLKEKYQPIRNALASEFRTLCPL